MNSYLFSIGVGVQDAPERWKPICGIYARLAQGLKRLGHRCAFLVNPDSFNARALSDFNALTGNHGDLPKIIERYHIDFCFIWGGRIDPDRRSARILDQYNVRPIFSELGWFPQKDSIYFDAEGTNSEMSVVQPKKMTIWSNKLFKLKRARVCQKIYGRSLRSEMPTTRVKRVFVPLQDETDTNITQDSPFKRMDDMLEILSRTYPDCQFTARLHPKAAQTYLKPRQNVDLQPIEANLFKSLLEFDLVIGINSTVISEAVFLGHPAMCFGDGIANSYGLAERLDPRNMPEFLLPPVETKAMQNALAYLFLDKQLEQEKLSSPYYLKHSYLNELLAL